MQRSMSYRKPVPTYVPSPPSSPPQPTFPPSTQPNLEVPPLPLNWREVLDQVAMLSPGSRQLVPTDARRHIEMDMTELASSAVSECSKRSNLTVYGGEVALPGPGPRSTLSVPYPQKHRFHQQYRPPTPPIPSQHRSRQSLLNSDNNSEDTLAHGRTDHFGLYHDYPKGGPGASSLKISSSFRTMGSFNTSNPSVGWFQGTTVRGLSNCPSLLNHEHDRFLRRIAGNTESESDLSFWKSLEAWAKKIRNFVIICK